MSNRPNLVPLDYPLGDRINVRGGGGKTTLTQSLAASRGVPFIELDAVFWLPNWVEREPEDFRNQTQDAIGAAANGWVVDGNYTNHLQDLVVRQADTVVWLDLPWRVMFWRTLIRSIQRAFDKETICGSNTESWRIFFSRDSLWWMYIKNRKQLIRRGERFLPLVPAGVPVVQIQSARDLNKFYSIHGLTR